MNVKDTSLREALHSRLFAKLQGSGTLTEDHARGCVLFENRNEVECYLGSDLQEQDWTSVC